MVEMSYDKRMDKRSSGALTTLYLSLQEVAERRAVGEGRKAVEIPDLRKNTGKDGTYLGLGVKTRRRTSN